MSCQYITVDKYFKTKIMHIEFVKLFYAHRDYERKTIKLCFGTNFQMKCLQTLISSFFFQSPDVADALLNAASLQKGARIK